MTTLFLLIFSPSPSLQVCRAERGERNHSFFFVSPQPRSVKAVCRALNKLILYLWGLGTIYLSCNVIRGTGWRTGNQQVLSSANAHTFHHLTLFLFPLHPHLNGLQGDYAAVTGNGKIAYSPRLSKSLQNKQISCKSLWLMCTSAALGLIHLRQPGSPSRCGDLRRKHSWVREEILHLHADPEWLRFCGEYRLQRSRM